MTYSSLPFSLVLRYAMHLFCAVDTHGSILGRVWRVYIFGQCISLMEPVSPESLHGLQATASEFASHWRDVGQS